MIYALQINASPYADHAGLDAYRFALAALNAGHRINRIFFYREGVYHALRYATPPDDEPVYQRQWAQLAAEHHIDLAVCISAAQRRGLLGPDEARRQGKLDDDLAPGFRIAGLGLWLEALLEADRHLIFD